MRFPKDVVWRVDVKIATEVSVRMDTYTEVANCISLRKLANAIYLYIFSLVKNENFITKIMIFFIFMLKTDCGYVRIASQRQF